MSKSFWKTFYSVDFSFTSVLIGVEILIEEMKRVVGVKHEFFEGDESMVLTKEFWKERTSMILIQGLKNLFFFQNLSLNINH